MNILSIRISRLFLAALLCWSFQANSKDTSAIASAHPLATAAGRAILERGGNAFDAAVAVAAALSVVEPYSSGLGGGGFFLLHRASDAYQVMIDARETAPSGVTSAHYIGADGKPIAGATVRGGTAAAVPGLPAGLAHVAHRFGKLPLAQSLAPAIALARDGFAVDVRYALMAKRRERFLQAGVNTAGFLDNGAAPEAGFVLRQPDLEVTLMRIAREGRAGFYEGPVAAALIETVNRAGGVWSAGDLARYRIVEREPVRFSYRGATITAAALPSAGGIALAQTLGMLDQFEIGAPGAPETDHLVVETLRRSFHDRARYLADPDFAQVPVKRLLARDYIQKSGADIDRGRATRSEALGPLEMVNRGSSSTTHLSVVDGDGNRVAATLTINLLFGAGVVGQGTGVLLNNEMDDFSLRPGLPNAFRLRGGAANAIEPGKRPLSSMTPVFVEDAKGVLVAGAPGGSRIVSQMLLAVLEYVSAPQVDLRHLVARPRYHHQYWPDVVEIEPQGFSQEWRAAMMAKGHTIQPANRAWGNMQAVFKARSSGAAEAASDPRGEGIAWY